MDCTVQYSTVQYSTLLHLSVLHCTVQYSIVLHCAVLYCTALHCTALCCAELYYTIIYYADSTHEKRDFHVLLVTVNRLLLHINKDMIINDKGCVPALITIIAYLAIDMKATSTPEFTFAEVSKNFIENSSASAFPFSNVTFYSS